MKYNLALQTDREAATSLLFQLKHKQCIVDIKEVKPKRSLNQNAYLHLIIGAFGENFGYTLEEAKILYKQINKDIYEYKKKGRTFYRSSADLNKEEMAKSIDVFMQKSAEAGCPLPLATDQAWLMSIENMIETSKHL